MCAQFHRGWWSYEWCCQDKITQFHVHMDKMVTRLQDIKLEDVTSLGTFSERKIKVKLHLDEEEDHDVVDFSEGMTELATITDVFLHGDICPETGRPRVTEAVLRCCSPIVMARSKGGVIYNGRPFATDLLALKTVQESSEGVCEYNITLCTPLLCAEHIEEEEEPVKETVKRKRPSTPDTRATVTGYDPSEVEQMSIREIMEMTFGNSQKACIQSGTGGW
jgi:protein OS-9